MFQVFFMKNPPMDFFEEVLFRYIRSNRFGRHQGIRSARVDPFGYFPSGERSRNNVGESRVVVSGKFGRKTIRTILGMARGRR
uniref:Uncharacterized protein n=1 Tax=Candidatus Kentrum sp. SD TaxID=2126332 RepID=A0A451BMT5_9GAMM|nr:MAG: hypothetical protein BECKSD772D_GA0070982_10557 [Candidatus Kentron sp. SD]